MWGVRDSSTDCHLLRGVGLTSGADVGGQTRDTVLAMLGNTENIKAFVLKFPDLLQDMIMRFLSTDDCEMEFSVIIGRFGYKPVWEKLVPFLHNQNELDYMKTNPLCKVSIVQSSTQRVSHLTANTRRDSTYNDGRLNDRNGKAIRALEGDVSRRAVRKTRNTKAIRSFHQQLVHAS